MKKIYTKLTTIIAIFALFFLYGAVIVFAVPPATQYVPGETLDPNCPPVPNTNCSVIVSNIYNTDGTLAEDRVFDLGSYNLDFENINQVNFRSDNGDDFVKFIDDDQGLSVSLYSGYYGDDNSWVFESPNGESMMIGGINNGNGGNDILIGDGAETIRLLSDVFIEGVNQDDTEDLILVLDTVNEIIEYRDASTLVSYDLYEENSVVGFTSPTPSGDNSVAIGDGSTASGKRSVAIGSINDNDGFPAPVASNDNAIAIGDFAVSSGIGAITIGSNGVEASGDYALAMGFGAKAIGRDSIAMGFHASASGVKSVAIGSYALAPSSEEMALGSSTTDYIPGTGAADRLFNIGNGDNSDLSDAFTILKNGEVGIGSDNFEANTNGNMFQVWDGAGSLIGYVDDATGNWVPVSDERTKKDIQNLEHGLDAINQLRPTSYKFKRNDAPAIGFIAQEIMEIIPEVVVGSEDTQYGVSYAALTPVLTKAIQELDIKITESEVVYALKKDDERTLKKILQSILDSVTSLVLDTVESVQGIFQKVETEELQVNDKLCVGDICVTEADFKAVFEDNSSSSNNKSETNSQDTSNESEEESTPDQEAEITEEESGNNEEEAEEESTPESESEPETESEPEPIPEPEFTSTEE